MITPVGKSSSLKRAQVQETETQNMPVHLSIPDVTQMTFEQAIQVLSVCVIVNPLSRNGEGERAGQWIENFIAEHNLGASRVEYTKYALHAKEIARSAAEDIVLVVAGDGTINEAASGLMERTRETRPLFAVVPCGNGDDYARTLGLRAKTLIDCYESLMKTRIKAMDVGVCNGRYFFETLSFGLDAAIALGTNTRRVETGKSGTRLYLEEGIDQLLHHRNIYRYTLGETASEVQESSLTTHAGAMHLLAVQIGHTYGGGFCIAPKADPADGLFDVCIAHPHGDDQNEPLSFSRATVIFLSAKNGKHEHFDEIECLSVGDFVIDFDQEPAVQIDGEGISGTHFEVHILPRALKVFSL